MSNNNKPQTEVIRRIHIDKYFLEVGEWPDCPDVVEFRTVGDANIEYFGPLNLTLTPEAAVQLGEALVATGRELMR